MNAGFAEAEALVPVLKRIVEDHEPLSTLEGYERQQQQRWQRLLGKTGGLRARPGTDPWLKDRAAALLPCLPGLDADLSELAGQRGLDIA